jgi:hypothetical protein
MEQTIEELLINRGELERIYTGKIALGRAPGHDPQNGRLHLTGFT